MAYARWAVEVTTPDVEGKWFTIGAFADAQKAQELLDRQGNDALLFGGQATFRVRDMLDPSISDGFERH